MPWPAATPSRPTTSFQRLSDDVDLFAPIDRRKITQISWGIPDHLLTAPLPGRPPRRPGQALRLLYAGRLTAEKGGAHVRRQRHEFQVLAPVLRCYGVHAHYLGWLRRPQLWRAFADHDALVMPSTTMKAMGLVALEAQARTLPVLYQPAPGLTEAIGASGLATDALADLGKQLG